MTTTERITSAKVRDEDRELDTSLRPRRLRDFFGQEKVKDQLHILLAAARARGEPLEHILLHGPPGLGKTTLAYIVAVEMRVNIRVTAGPAIEHAQELASVLTQMKHGDILFIDEVHRLNRAVEERLYPAMEDYALDIVTGRGPAANVLHLALQRFTLVGATTRMALLTAPLRDRFGVIYRLEFYTAAEMEAIVHRSARILGVTIDDTAAAEIACRSRRTPRIANRLLKRVRDYAQVMASGIVTLDVTERALAMLEIDELGLDNLDRRILETILVKFRGGPVGRETLAAAVGEEADTIEDVYEPYLVQLGFLDRSPRGRMATGLAAAHLGLPDPRPPRPDQPRLI